MGVSGRGALWGAVAVFCFFVGVLPASAAELPPYKLNAELSLTGDCSVTPLDPIPDPSCPYPPPPGGPSGRFDEPRSVAVDAYGNVYVAVFANGEAKGRIDVFDDEGKFITELPDPRGPKSLAVDSKGNLYVFEGQSIVRYAPTVYEPEAGKIGYGNVPIEVVPAHFLNRGIAVDLSNDHLYVARLETIAEYSSAAEGNKLLDTITHPAPANWSTWVAVDSERRRLYASVCRHVSDPFDCVVRVFEADAPHKLLKEVEGPNPPAEKFGSVAGKTSIAVDEETGDFFVEDIEESDTVYQFNKDYELVSQITNSAFQGGNPLQIAVSNSPLNEDAVSHRFLFVPVLPSGNRVLAFEPPGVLPPEVVEASVLNIAEDEAEIQATIDPNGGDTEYVVEYVTEQAFEEEGFAGARIAGEGTIPGASLPTQVSAPIEGLSPGVSYRVRVLAENEAGEAEPITERTFATYFDAPVSGGPCPNDDFRIGFSSVLPDCRAYELVTPPDTNGRPVRGASFAGDQFSRELSSPAGNVVSFLIEGGVLPGMEGVGGLEGDAYKATRSPSGWTTTSNGPRGSEASVVQPGGVSSDQAFSFWRGRGAGSAVVEGKETHMIRYPDGHSELTGIGSLGTDPGAVGRFITPGGTHIVFQTRILTPEVPQQLEPNAPPTGTEAVYDRAAGGVTHVVSLLPGNITPAAGQHATYLGASADGSGIAFEIGDTLYLREDNAVTFEISENVEFAGVSANGERIFYVESGDLKAFDTDSEEVIAFSSVGNAKVVNVAPDGTRAYFVTTSAIPGGGQNPNGAFAKAGQQNLYLSEEGDVTFVATVTARDVEGEAVDGINLDGLGLWTEALDQPLSEVVDQLVRDPSRLTPDGTVMLFQSRANLDGYDPGTFAQIYRYDSVADRLDCISCIPTGVPANGGASLQTPTVIQSLRTDAPSSLFGFVSNLRADGKRAFFESEEPLVSTDTNEAKDVYEWEEEGVGSCERAGGCVYLISSGRSAQDNYLFAHSDSGDDVFFTTNDVLTGADLGATTSVYDARVGGGFPEEPEPPCVGEGCRPGLPPVPGVVIPGKAGPGPGNFTSPRKSRPCRKGKRKVKRQGKVRCVKKHRAKKHRKHQRKAGAKRGATK